MKSVFCMLASIVLLAACTPSRPPMPTTMPSATSESTITSTEPPPSASGPIVEVDGVQYPDPIKKTSLIDATYRHSLLYSLKNLGVQFNPADIVANLKYGSIKGTDNVVAYFDYNSPDDKFAFLNGKMPLAVYDNQTKAWRLPGYKDLTPPNITAGSEINAWTGDFYEDPRYKETFLNLFNVGATGGGLEADGDLMKPLQNVTEKLTPEEIIAKYDWTRIDDLVNFMNEHNIAVKLHALVDFGTTDTQIPPVIKKLSNEELKQFLDLHIKTIEERYPKASQVTVVNEAFFEGGMPGNNFLFSRLGRDYVKDAFMSADKYRKAVLINGQYVKPKLLLNDNLSSGNNTNHLLQTGSADAIADYIAEQRAAGVPIEGFGLESHLKAGDFMTDGKIDDEKIAQFKEENITAIKKFGDVAHVPVYFSELDLNDSGIPSNMPDDERQILAAKIYQAVFEAALKSGNVGSLTMWGFTDASTWLKYDPLHRKPDYPFDEQYNPQLSYFAILQALINNQ